MALTPHLRSGASPVGGSTCRYSFSGGTYKGGEEEGISVGTGGDGEEVGGQHVQTEREEGREGWR